jgi:heat shock protein HslJ
MRRTFLAVAGALVLLALAGCGGDDSSELQGVRWKWTAQLEGEATAGLSPVPNPERYLLTLNEDGTFDAKAGCNPVRGTYALSGHDLTLDLGQMTKAACAPGSLSDRYLSLLRRVANYDLYHEGQVALGLEEDAGYMYFNSG